MQRINVRLVIILFLVAFFGTGATYLLYRIQLKRSASSLLRLAEEKLAAGKKAEASEFMKRYAVRKQKDPEVWKRLALLMRDRFDDEVANGTVTRKTASETFTVLETAIRLSPEDEELRQTAVDLSMQYRLVPLTDAIEHLEYLIESRGKNAKPDWKVQLARVYEASGQVDKAAPILAEMVGWDPDSRQFDESKAISAKDTDAYWNLARLLRARNLNDRADEVIDRMVEMNPEDAIAHVRRGSYRMQTGQGDLDSWKEDAGKALQFGEDQPDALVFAGQLALREKDFIRAKALFERCRELHPDRIDAILGLYEWAMQQQKLDMGLEYLSQGLKEQPQNGRLLFERGFVEFIAGKASDVKKTLTEARRIKMTPMYVQLLQAYSYLQDKEWLKAAQILAEVRPQFEVQDPTQVPRIDNLLLSCYEQLGQIDQQLVVLERILERTPDNLAMRLTQLNGLLRLGQTERALAEFDLIEKSLTEDSELAKSLLPTRLQMETLRQKRLPEDVRDWKRAKALAEQLAAIPAAKSGIGASFLADYYQASGDSKSAQTLIASATDEKTTKLNERITELGKQIESEPLETLLKQLDEMETEFGASLVTRLNRAFVILKKNPPNIDDLLRQLEEPPKEFNEEQKLQWIRQLGMYYAANNRTDDARRLWTKGIESFSNAIDLRIMRFELALNGKDDQKLTNELKEFEKVFGKESAEWSWGEAARITMAVAQGKEKPEQLDTALRLLTAAAGKRKNWSAIYSLQGDIQLLRKEPQAALASYRQAKESGGGSPAVMRKIAELQYAAQNFAEVEKALAQLPKQFWTDREHRMSLHVMAAKNQLPDDIRIDQFGASVEAYLFTGSILADGGKPEKAAEAFRKAAEVAPGNPLPWSNLVLLLARQNRVDEARKVIEEARPAVEEKALDSFLATAYRLVGDAAEAEKHLKNLLDKRPEAVEVLHSVASFYLEQKRSSDALAVAEKLLKVAKTDDPNQIPFVRAARRIKAAEIAKSGNYDDYQAAIKLLRENGGKDEAFAPEDLVLWGQLALPRSDSDSRTEALAVLQDAARQRPLPADAAMAMAQLMNRNGDWSGCQSTMTDLLIRFPNDLRVLDPWLRMLLARGDVAQAAKWVTNCPEGSLAQIRTQSFIDAQGGKSKEVLDRFRQILSSAKTPEEQQQRLGLVAQLAEELAPYDKTMRDAAEAAWKRLVALDPKFQLNYVDFLLRRNEVARAKDVMKLVVELQRGGQVIPAVQRGVRLIRQFEDKLPGKAEWVSAVRKWIDEASAQSDDNGQLVLEHSELEAMLGNEDEQQRLLRGFLERHVTKDTARAIVLNNLAYVLALHGEGDEAERMIDEAVAILGPQPILKDTIGVIRFAQGKTDEAVRLFEEAINAGLTSSVTYVHLASARWKQGEEDLAKEALERAFEGDLSSAAMSRLDRQKLQTLMDEMEKKGIRLDGLEREATNPVGGRATEPAASK